MGIQINGVSNKISSGSKIDFPGSVGVAGTLTYEDVANVDSIGIITARTGINIGPTAGVAGTFFADGSYVTAGVVTATTFYGSGANLTGINADLVNDTSPQLGGNLDTNSHNIYLDDDHKVIFGNDQSADLHIFHESSSGTGNIYNATGQLRIRTNDLRLKNLGNTETYLRATNNGSVELYHDNALKLTTESDGIKIHAAEGGEAIISLFADEGDDAADKYRIVAQNSGDLVFQRHNGSGFSSELRLKSAGGIQANYQGSNKFETTSTGVTISGNANFANNNKAIFGTGNDAAIYHNDTDFHIDAQESGATRNIYMTCGTVNEGGFYVRSDAGDTMFKALTDSSCFLYFDDSLKFRTMTDHCEIRGHLLPDTNNTDDIGSSSKRFRNIYTNDLNLSNEGSQNDVDGTWGDYTIQEGESDLFLINKRSGKKFKFMLQEVN